MVRTYKQRFNKKYGLPLDEPHSLKEIAKLCRCKLGDFYDSKEEAEKREH